MSWLKTLFKKNNVVDDFVLALDIGTEFVKTLLFQIAEEGENAVVLGTGKVRQKFGNMRSGVVTDIHGVVETCMQSIEEACADLPPKYRPDQAVMGIAGELVKGTTTTIQYERTKPDVKIDLSELKNIIQRVQWEAFDKIRKKLSWETGHSEIDVKLINAAISEVSIDGYRVNNPLGFQGKNISISIFNAYAPMMHLGALQTIAQELSLDLLSITAEPYAVSKCLGIGIDHDFSAIFLDVGGGTTDIAIVRNGGIEGTHMFALGGRAFSKRLVDELGVNFEQAEVIKYKYSKGTLSHTVSDKIKKLFADDASVWLSGVELALNEFKKSDLLPSKILLCGGGASLPDIKTMLESPGWTKDLPFAKPPKVFFIQPKDVVNVKDETGKLTSIQDVTPMALANLAIDLVDEEEQVLSQMLKRVIRIIQT
jgi:cell division protein FtsA